MANNKTNAPDSNKAVFRSSIKIILLLLLLGAGIYFGWLYYASSTRFSVPSTENTSLEESDAQADIGPMIDVRELIVNIISDDNSHYLRTSMSIELSSKDAYEEMNSRMPQIRDAILMLTSSKTFEELYDVHGKKQLKAELLIEVNELLTRGEAVAIYFTDFVVQ